MELSVEIDLTEAMRARVKLVESTGILVGILDKSQKAAIPKSLSEGTRNLPNYSKGLKVRRIAGRSKDYTVAEQLADLEQAYSLLTGALNDKENRDLEDIIEIMGDLFNSGELKEEYKARLRNAAQALIRNRIIENRLGNNSRETTEEKGRNMPLMDTGNLFTQIKAELEKI